MGSPRHAGDHEQFDMGEMYKEEWVQNLIQQIQDCIISNGDWIGIDKFRSQYILDYACGNGTVSKVDRYNDEARKMLGDSADRMHAIVGDVMSPSSDLEKPEWFNFDLAFISAALHHCADPVNMLTRLCKRLKKGGMLVVVEWLRVEALEAESGFSASFDGSNQASSVEFDAANMVEIIGGQKIWQGFTQQSLEAAMLAAGFANVETRLHPETIWLPGLKDGGGANNRIILVKGTSE